MECGAGGTDLQHLRQKFWQNKGSCHSLRKDLTSESVLAVCELAVKVSGFEMGPYMASRGAEGQCVDVGNSGRSSRLKAALNAGVSNSVFMLHYRGC